MRSVLWRFFLIPSVYGFLVWAGLLLLLQFDLIQVDISHFAWGIFLYLLVCFLFSAFLFFRLSQNMRVEEIGARVEFQRMDGIVFFISTLIGIYGLFLYVNDFSAAFGGIGSFLLTFFIDPLAIRALAAEETSAGFQISYLSWISIYYCVFVLAKNVSLAGVRRFWIFILLLVEVFLNLLFVDRTRPVILLVVCFLAFILMIFKKLRNPFRLLCFVFLGPLIIFFAQAVFTGKYDVEEGVFKNFLVYVFGGFGYFSDVLNDVMPDYGVSRIFYPIAKFMQALGWVSDVPAQILDFREIPFPTNVGTFLEPLVSDGGVVFLVLGIPLVVFFTDFFAYIALKSKSAFGFFLWGNLVLIATLSFFVPKYNSTSIYLFYFVYIFFFGLLRLPVSRLNRGMM